MIPENMRGLVVQAPGKYDLENLPVPQISPGGLLLKVAACGLCGSDLRTLRSGHHRVTLPWLIGHELAGTIVEVGEKAGSHWKVGEMLAVGPLAYCGVCDYCFSGAFELCENYREIAQAWPGGFADYIAIPEECVRLGNVRAIPENADPAHAAISEPVSSCIHAQEKGNVSLGDTVVIIGSGPVGCIHTSLARARGADKVILVDIVDERLKLAEAFEPDHIINASKTDLVSEVLRLTAGKGAEVIITATPAPEAQVQAVQMARKGGRILLFGGLPPHLSKPGVDMNTIHYNALHVIGTTIFAPRHHLLALKLILSGKIPIERLICKYPLSSFKEGAGLALEGKILKAVFIP
jgi:L-iditol 2-dehydrogenase